ncbi:phenolic glucoside malonyltransferase 2-like [Impatiens glandulifera]|uniref:phenolic glucoside malonyltransferase 2-like n=1 Tax=Impatiens glandulifera TaxID=253017 RepID=UPI001FB17CB8|nr:phenolic glucoside malonyltransferase 2-like [Impatiens glandulifera]
MGLFSCEKSVIPFAHLFYRSITRNIIYAFSSKNHLNSIHKDSLPLTFFDLLWLRNPPSRRLFFFQYPYSLHCFSQTVLPRLKQSLSAALNPYPHFAGNVTWRSSLRHHCRSHHRRQFPTHLNQGEPLPSRQHFLLPPTLFVSPEWAAVMSLQITLFPNNGFGIGYTSNHAVIDGKTTTLFMKSWAWFCRSGGDTTTLPADLTPFYDRNVINTNLNDLNEAYLAHYLKYEGESYKTLMKLEIISLPDMVIGNFMLTWAIFSLESFIFRMSEEILTISLKDGCFIHGRGSVGGMVWMEVSRMDLVETQEDGEASGKSRIQGKSI